MDKSFSNSNTKIRIAPILAKLRLLCALIGITLRALLVSLSSACTSHNVAFG